MYSALTRAAEAPKFPAKLPAKSVINQLKKAPGVKQAEIDAVGLAEWLEGKDRVTKAEVVDFLRMNEVRIEEVEKGKTEDFSEEQINEIIEYLDLDKYTIEEKQDSFSPDMIYRVYSDNFSLESEDFKSESDAVEAAQAEAKKQAVLYLKRKNIERSNTKFAEYVLPGGEPGSYRELVLRMPDKQPVPVGKINIEEKETSYIVTLGQHKIEVGKNIVGSKQAAREYAEPLIIEKEIEAVKKRSYKSAHWDEPNVIAHIRGDTRTIDGKRIFHIAEFQSDIYSRMVELGSEKAGEIFPSAEVAAKELANLKKLFPWGENWHELVAKKAIEYAIKNDFDGISWDTAKTQVDRWESALRKSVDRINWSKAPDNQVWISGEKNKEFVFKNMIPLQGKTIIEGHEVTLDNLIG
ncbi:MAG: hypothetical protein J7K15_02855, partial [Deltaproteobacteria bacterium]|nr:hypothetical protein [Deltaproteobacteria bacterium]